MKHTILVADDDVSVRDSLKKILEDCGYGVVLACDGVEAQTELQARQPDLVILDLDMPRKDGWDVLDEALAISPLLPIVVVTGFGDQLDTYSIRGAAALMSKPVEAERILAEVARLLAEPAAERALRAAGRPGCNGFLSAGSQARMPDC